MGANLISVTLKELPGALDKGDAAIRAAVAFGARAGAERGRAYIVSKTPTDLGQLRASWKVRKGAGDVFAELVNDAPHIAIVELGARPHMVSAEGWAAIYEWVRRHHRGGKLGGAGSMRPRRTLAAPVGPFKGDDPEISAITWGIVRKIQKYGQPATLFVLNSLDTLRTLMATELARALERAKGGR